MGAFVLNILLAVAWAALLGTFSGTNLIAGFVLGYIMIWLMQQVMSASSYFIKIRQIIRFLRIFSWELIVSNIRVFLTVLGPFHKMTPAIVAIPLDIDSDGEITLLANMITLTPGTLSLDVSDDRRFLYVHGMHIKDIEAFKQEIKGGFEVIVREVLE